MKLPSVEAVNDRRVQKFLGRITDTLASGQAGEYRSLVEGYEQEHNVPMVDIAAALARLGQGETPLLLAPERAQSRPSYDAARSERPEGGARPGRGERPARRDAFERSERPQRRSDSAPSYERPAADRVPGSFDKPARESRIERPELERPGSERARFDKPPREKPEVGMESFRIEVGHAHGVKPANIVGAIANEAGLDSKYIGRIDIQDDYTVLDLPEGMPKELLMHLKKVWVSGQQLRIHKLGEDAGEQAPRKFKPAAARTDARPRSFKSAPKAPAKPHRKGPPKPS